MMTDASAQAIASVLSHVERLRNHEMTAAIHCSKINSLFSAFKVLSASLRSLPTVRRTPKFRTAIASLNQSIEHFVQLCIQCTRESCVQFVLMKTTQQVFEEFLEIRQTTITDLNDLGLTEAARTFTLSSNELLSQDQIDLKRIGNFLLQLREQHDLSRRDDIKEKITERLQSLRRKDIKIELSDCDPIEILTVPTLPENLDLVLAHENLVFQEEIGSGRSGRVFKGVIKGRNGVVAIKVMHCRQLSSAELEMFRREIFTLSTMNHPSILKLLGYTKEPPFCLVTEMLANGSLFQFLRTRNSELTPTDRTAIALDIARGMDYMHERTVIHRDLKSLNILLDDNKRARICDFGLVRLKSLAPMTGLVGTPQWMAPEILMCSTYYDGKVDVYSYGVVLWELMTGEMPYNNVDIEKLPYLVVQEKLRPKIPDSTPTNLKNLISACWAPDPKDRPTFDTIIKLLNVESYHYPGTNTDELWARVGGKRKRTPSTSDPLKLVMDPDDLGPSITAVDSRSRFRLSLSQIDKAIIRLREAVANENAMSMDRALSDIRSLYKSNVLTSGTNSCISEVLVIIKEANNVQKQSIMRLLNELTTNPSLRDQFYASDGMALMSELMCSESEDVADLALEVYGKCISKEYITIEGIKGLLGFSARSSQKTRQTALVCLFQVIDLQMQFLFGMPSFIYHLLCFSLRPLPDQMFEKLIDFTVVFLKHIKSFPESVLPQLIWLQTNCRSSISKPKVVLALKLAVHFDSVRDIFPPDFWKTAASDFETYKPIYQAFVGRLPQKYTEMIHSLRELSPEKPEALDLLVEFTRDVECAKLIVPTLPIQNRMSPGGLFKLYSNLTSVEGATAIISEEPEFYTVCNLVVSSHFQNDACQLIRKVGLNPSLLESSSLVQHIALLIRETKESNALWNLMSVVFTLSKEKFFSCFTNIIPKLRELLNGKEMQIRIGAFLCLTSFCRHCTDINRDTLLDHAAVFVNIDNPPVQAVCCDFLEQELKERPVNSDQLKRLIESFTAHFLKGNELALKFATLLKTAANAVDSKEPFISNFSMFLSHSNV